MLGGLLTKNLIGGHIALSSIGVLHIDKAVEFVENLNLFVETQRQNIITRQIGLAENDGVLRRKAGPLLGSGFVSRSHPRLRQVNRLFAVICTVILTRIRAGQLISWLDVLKLIATLKRGARNKNAVDLHRCLNGFRLDDFRLLRGSIRQDGRKSSATAKEGQSAHCKDRKLDVEGLLSSCLHALTHYLTLLMML